MGNGKSEDLTLKVTAEGADQAAKDVAAVGKATDEVQQKTKASTDAAKQHTDVQQTLNAKEEDFLGLLRGISPALADFTEGLLRGGRVAGDLASTQIDLNSVLEQGAGFIKQNAAALKLLVAGGSAVVGVSAIAAAFGDLADEAERAERGIENLRKARDELLGKRTDTQAELERLASIRQEGPLSAAESEQVVRTAEQLGKRPTGMGVRDEARLQAALLGGGRDLAGLEQLAVLLDRFGGDVDVERLLRMEPGARAGRLDQALAKRAGRISAIQQTEQEQFAALVKRAVEETKQQGGGAFNLSRFIESLPGTGLEGVDVELLAKAVAGLEGVGKYEQLLGELKLFYRSLGRRIPFISSFVRPDQAGTPDFGDFGYFRQQARALALESQGVYGVSPDLVTTAEQLLKNLERVSDNLERLANRPPVQNINNSRFIGPDGRSRQLRTTNGASELNRRIGAFR